MRLQLWILCLVAVVAGFVAGLMAGGGGSVEASTASRETSAPWAASSQPFMSDFVAFGRELTARINAGEDLAPFLIPVQRTCPQYTGGAELAEICQGIAAGTVVTGCISGRIAGDASFHYCEAAGERPRELRVGEFGGAELHLNSTTLTGHTVGTLACPDCPAVILASPPDSAGRRHFLEFQPQQTGDGWRIHSWAVGQSGIGPEAAAMLNGGTVDGRTFVLVGPIAPGTGTGMARPHPPGPVSLPLLAIGGAGMVAGALGWLTLRLRRPRSAGR